MHDSLLAPAVRVLGDRALFCSVASFMRGWPRLILDFQRDVVPKYKNALDQQRQPPLFPKKVGLLPHVAIAEASMDVLKMLCRLHELPYYRRTPAMRFAHAMRCAAFFGRLEMLAWLYPALSSDDEWTWELDLMDSALKNPEAEVALLRWLSDHCPLESLLLHSNDGVETQIQAGNLDAIRYLHEHGYRLPAASMDTAATCGQLAIVRYLHEVGLYICSTKAMDGAARNGHLELVRFLHEHRSEGCTTDAMDDAAHGGFLGVVQFLHEHRPEGCTFAAMDYAASNGHREVVRFLHERREEGCSSLALVRAKANGDLKMVKYLHKYHGLGHFPSWHQKYTEAAPDNFRVLESQRGKAVAAKVRANHLGVARFLHENPVGGSEFTVTTIEDAARYGHLDVVKFLHENGVGGATKWAMDYAAWLGHLKVIRFLHEKRSEGCTTRAMDFAASAGHVDIVKFLHENRGEGCKTEAMDRAAFRGCLDTVRFLHEHRREGCTTSAMDNAAGAGHLEIVRFLHERRREGCTRHAMDQAAAGGHLDIVRFLHENRKEGCTPHAMDNAARYGHLEVVKFLHENRSEGCTSDAMVLASGRASEHLDIVQFLHEHRGEACPPQALERAVQSDNLAIVNFLLKNRLEVSSLRNVPTRLWSHECVKYACLNCPESVPETLLNECASENKATSVAVLCAFSSRGCLFEARALALDKGFSAVVDVLSAFASSDLETCSLAQHSPGGPRACQSRTRAAKAVRRRRP